jgi:hypothetical protein
LTRAILNRRSFTLWEEGQIWREGAGVRLKGLYSGSRITTPASGNSIVAGGPDFNKAFSKRIAAGRPERLLVYAGNAHVVHVPMLYGAEPRTGRPHPFDAAATSGARVVAFAVSAREEWLNSIDEAMTQALACDLSSGRLAMGEAAAEIRWCLEFLDEARGHVRRTGTFVVAADPTEAAPSKYLVVVNDDERYWLLGPMDSLRRVLEHPAARASEGESEIKLDLIERIIRDPAGLHAEEFHFLLKRPESGRKVTFRVTPEDVEAAVSSLRK